MKKDMSALDPTVQHRQLLEREDLATATFAGGCFWCMEGPFEAMDGVEEALVGYAGGTEEDATYQRVASGQTDHREATQVFFDPTVVSFAELLERYWHQVDPTDPGGQFADRGYQYTTAIYYHDDEQRTETERQIAAFKESGRYDAPIATEVLPFTTFYPAEAEHQDFYQKRAAYYQRYKRGSGREAYIAKMKKS